MPIGVNINNVEELIMTSGNQIDFIDKSDEIINSRDVEYSINTKYEIRNRYQAEGLTFLTSDELFHSKLLALATGYGKTYTAVMAAFRLKLPILIISETLVQQWIERIEDYTELKTGKDVISIVGTQYLEDVIHGKVKPDASIYIVTINTLSKLMELYGYEELQKLADKLNIICGSFYMIKDLI